MTNPDRGYVEVAVLNTFTNAQIIPNPGRGGQVHIPSGSSITTLTWASYDPKNATTHPAKTEADLSVAVVQTGFSAGDSFPVPGDLFAASSLLVKGNLAGTILITQKA